ncbi:sodium-dependent transporter [Candidatus Palauibacter sp.]|uniref:sodium-dependent transporter n=1 Tax=Candidatus Palauibacter sp. TaxID=3101350 RepID=UPI003B5CD698
MNTPRERWGSPLGFILATTGFSVGLGNIWRFPYLVGENGGGAFLLIYVLLALLIGIPLFTAEISLGRRAQATPLAGMRKLVGRSPFRLIGWLGAGAAFLIMAYYQLIMGWIAAYFIRAFTGGYRAGSVQAAAESFAAFTSRPGEVLAYTVPVMLLSGFIITRGLRRGIERAARLLIPVLFLSLVGLGIISLRFDGAWEGVRWYLAPDFSAIGPETWLAALGQAFYSIGVGMMGAFVFGSYLHTRKSNIPGSAATIVACDTIAAILAGLVMFPALFAFGLEPDQGAGLLFVTMTGLFGRLPAGEVAAAFFFFFVFIAGLTSGLALLEALAASAMDSLGWSRRRSLWAVVAMLLLAGVPLALGFGPWQAVRIGGRGLFEFADYVSGNIFLTVGGLAISLYVAAVWGFERFRTETNQGAGRLRVTAAWGPVMRFVVPVAVGIVVLAGLGLLG